MTMGSSPVSLVLLAGLLWFSDIAEAGCSESQKCCNGRDHTCSSIGWTMNRVYGTCYCDQACRSTGDCCYDYIETCPGPAFISTAAYNKERRKLAAFEDKEIPGYCTEFTIESLSFHCTVENRSFARWMQYLREGYTVCVTCQPPAMNSHNHRCHGDGANDNGNIQYLDSGLIRRGQIMRTHVFQWQAVGNPQCRGTWRKVREVAECSCPIVHSFIFT
ncbi:somatomedin-B and thrombospondin type-1 domain-containing protein isoform X3 [Hemiscyllium ocellatum]|uniref:somatomedin-B and thrombospondin type-1 domain-containing protein isoform X3 n=1 Tax=Hemiscyllium ocellatum TaxID=170820 RepID=UPI002966CD0A|nr:somatomedin-B and thrombospondin type-1 domain-containing protein isoform X3 [Hemiscyllium ocellatum]